MNSVLESVQDINLLPLEREFLTSFGVGETKLFLMPTKKEEFNHTEELIKKFIKNGYFEDVDKLHNPNSVSWRLKRIK